MLTYPVPTKLYHKAPSLSCRGLHRKWYLTWALLNDGLAFTENAYRYQAGIPSIFD